MRFAPPLSLFLISAALLFGCSAQQPRPDDGGSMEEVSATPTHHGAQAAAEAESAEDLPEQELTGETMFRLLLGEIAGQRGITNLSAEQYQVVASETRDPRVARRATQIALYARDFRRAEESAGIWVDIAPENLEARQTLAKILVRNGKSEQATPHLEYLLEGISSDTRHAFMLVHNILMEDEQAERSLQVMQKLTRPRFESEPKEAMFAEARLAHEKGLNEHALGVILMLREQGADDTDTISLHARVLHGLERKDEAYAMVEDGVKEYPDSIILGMVHARMLIEQQRLDEAREQFNKLYEQVPEDPDVLYALGLLALQNGQMEEAKPYFEQLVQQGQRSDEASYSLGQIAEEEGQDMRAAQWYSRVGPQSHYYLDAKTRLIRLIARLQGKEIALRHLDRIQWSGEEQLIQRHLLEAEIYIESADYAVAMDVYNRALEEYPGDHSILYARAMLGERMGRFDVLERDLQAIIADDENSAHALNALGYTMVDRLGRYKEGYEYIQRAYTIKPSDPAIMDSMGWALYRLGEMDRSLEFLQKAYATLSDPEIAAHLGEVLWSIGLREKAKEVWQEALRKYPEHGLLNRVYRHFNP